MYNSTIALFIRLYNIFTTTVIVKWKVNSMLLKAVLVVATLSAVVIILGLLGTQSKTNINKFSN